jgi:glycosyltransferase involved in cell wall biosynthesis
VSGIHQFVPVLHGGDAVGRHTLCLRDAIAARGIESRIYVDTAETRTRALTSPVLDYPAHAAAGDVLLYQFATASPMAPWLATRPETLVVNYHNITPPELLAPWDNHLALGQLRAQSELALLVPRTALAVADSAYNRGHLEKAGFAATAVVPPSAALGPDVIAGSSGARSAGRARTTRNSGAQWLCVGRIAPNKAIEDIVAALAVTRRHADPEATLAIIGKPATASYVQALHRYVAALGLSGAVAFGGHASDAAVAAAYAQSDVLVVTSEHEGYCVPVVEAMAVGLPVVAFRQGALPEVLGDGGVLVDSKDPYTLSSTIGAVLSDASWRARLAQQATVRLAELDLATAADRFVTLLCRVQQGAVASGEGVKR